VHETISIEEWVQRYLRRLIQRNKPRGNQTVSAADIPPFLPNSSFVTPSDEVFECEEELK
jgi:hypothetical protein